MSNIYINGDSEGFGLVLLLTQFYGITCLVSNIDGIGGRISDCDIVLNTKYPHQWINRIK